MRRFGMPRSAGFFGAAAILWSVCFPGFPGMAREAPEAGSPQGKTAAGSAELPEGEDTAKNGTSSSPSLEDLAAEIRPSTVVISATDRRGEERGTGSGFVVREDGLIATNFHVIGEHRPFTVRFADGRSFEPLRVLGYDRGRDVAVFQIDAQGLRALELGESSTLRAGQMVASLGNPLGFEHSVARGVVAAPRRDVRGKPMIQVAMPIEPGSSGSPLFDEAGRVVGVITIKSADALGFAVPAEDLARLLDDPRPIPFDRWLTIGALDALEWTAILGGRWRQRAGKLIASGEGSGFAGRMLCLSRSSPPDGSFEIEVEVRLEDESGAAGLAFHSDGEHRHYGFYPTNGALRLTRFEGPVVFTWTILRTVKSDAYRPGEWNFLRVRVAGPAITCYVNGEPVIDLVDDGLRGGQAGLVKFRSPAAEFRHFRLGKDLPEREIPAETIQRVDELTAKLGPDLPYREDIVVALSELGPEATEALEIEVRESERRARRLRRLIDEVRLRSVERRLRDILDAPEEEVDLLAATLELSFLDNRELQRAPYFRKIERMAEEALELAGGPGASEEARLDALIEYLFEERGFHGSRSDYYHRSNSYINEVLDDREGIPITLSVVFLELGRRLELPVFGLSIPRHFIVIYRPRGGKPKLIDPYGGGKFISPEEAAELSGTPIDARSLEPASARSIVLRMLRNLLGVAQAEDDDTAVLRYLDLIVALDGAMAEDRWLRASLRIQTAERWRAIEDLDWLIANPPPGIDLDGLRRMREALREERDE